MGKKGYLFVYFTGESEWGEQVYFSVSEDGLHWRDLNMGRPVLKSHVGEEGVRDPFIIRAVDGTRFYIIATDLRMAKGHTWEEVQVAGSKSIVVWESENLVDWSRERLTEVGIPEAGCVWAPEAIYYEKENCYMVFWASNVMEENDKEARQRIYASFTRDFRSFTRPQKYIDQGGHVIDTTIVQEGMYYYRISKNEITCSIGMDRGTDLMGQAFEPVVCHELEQIQGVEGPQIFPLNDSGRWCLIIDRFATNGGYLPLVCDDLKNGDFHVVDEGMYDMGKNKKRHGSVLCITESEMEKLIERYGVEDCEV